MDLKAKRRLTGDYGTVNQGDTITVSEAVGQQLVDNDFAEVVTSVNPTATPEQVMDRNVSGSTVGDNIHADGTDREILNTDGRMIHNSGEEAVAEAQARVEASIAPKEAEASEPTNDSPEETSKKKGK